MSSDLQTGLATKRVALRPVQDGDMPFLLTCRNDPIFLATCTTQRNIMNQEGFAREVKTYSIPMIITRRETSEPVGFIYARNVNKIDGLAFVNTYISEHHRTRGYGPVALLLFMRHCFQTMEQLHKIYLDAYEYARSVSPMTTGIQRFGFVLEGRFKEHRVHDGKRWDMLRFAVYRESLPGIELFLERVGLDAGGAT